MIATESKPAVSAVVVNHNGGQAILNCLAALETQAFPLAKIIVVDNASTDHSPENVSVQFPRVDLVRLPSNIGLSRARNIGLRRTETELALIIDDDVYVDGECLHHLRAALLKHSAAVACPRIVFFPGKQTVQCDGAAPHFTGTLLLRNAGRPVTASPEPAASVPGCIGACMLLDRRAALSAGGFDEEYFFYFEDLEFSLRMRMLGHDVVCNPQAIVFHDRGKGTPRLSFRGDGEYPELRFFLNVRNRWMTILMHYTSRTLLVLSPALIFYEMATIIVALQRGWGRRWKGAILSVCAARVYVKTRRKELARKRVRGDKALLSGGKLPLTRGFTSTESERMAVAAISLCLNGYWRLVKRFIG